MNRKSVFDHISIGIRDLKRSSAFYDAVLAPLGLVRLLTETKASGWGTPPPHSEAEAPFAVVQEPPDSVNGSTSMAHIALKAPTRAAVVAFYEAAVANGADVQHAPRLWHEYSPTYFAAFVGDPDGYNIEAVCHEAE